MDDLRSYLVKHDVDAEIIDLEVAMPTAEAAANQLEISVGGIFKSLVLAQPDGNCVVAVLAGDAKLDKKTLAKLLGVKKLKFASAEVVLDQTGYPAGGTPPIGHQQSLPVYLDRSTFDHEFGYGGGGRHELLLKIRPQEIERVSGATVVKFLKR